MTRRIRTILLLNTALPFVDVALYLLGRITAVRFWFVLCVAMAVLCVASLLAYQDLLRLTRKILDTNETLIDMIDPTIRQEVRNIQEYKRQRAKRKSK